MGSTTLKSKLTQWQQLPEEQRNEFRTWLVSLCLYTEETNCSGKFNSSVRRNRVFTFYQTYESAGQQVWEHFFGLHNPRRDVVWKKGTQQMTVPVRTSGTEVDAWLKEEIEDEWIFEKWQTKIVFNNQAAIEVQWIPGALPNVNGPGGDIITMDANVSLDDWSTRSTIRHEFGHALGFIDCYIEFYDDEEEAMVNYQLDTEDLMCSGSGKIQKRHVETLRQKYYRR